MTGPLRIAELPVGQMREFAVVLANTLDAATLRALQRGPAHAKDCATWGLLPAEWRCAVTAALGELQTRTEEPHAAT